MSFSFNPSMIAASGGDYISATRFLIADTTAPAEVSDEIITALYNDTPSHYTQEARVYWAASEAAQYVYRLYAKQASFSSGGTSVQLAERANQWGKLAMELVFKATHISTGTSGVIYTRRQSSW